MKRLVFILLFGCGPGITILPPNDSPTKVMCNKAYDCKLVAYADFFKCNDCLNTWLNKDQANADFINDNWDKLDAVTCEEIKAFASVSGVATCISDK